VQVKSESRNSEAGSDCKRDRHIQTEKFSSVRRALVRNVAQMTQKRSARGEAAGVGWDC